MPRRRAFRCTNILATLSGRDAAGCLTLAGIILYGTEDLPAAVFRNKQLTRSLRSTSFSATPRQNASTLSPEATAT